MSSGVIPDSPCRPPWPWTLGRRALTGTALLLLGVAPSLLAHPKVRRSSPAAGDTVTSLSEVSLSFDKPVEPALATLVLLAPDGRRIVLRPRAGAAQSELLASVSPTPAPGTYSVEWKVAGGDWGWLLQVGGAFLALTGFLKPAGASDRDGTGH